MADEKILSGRELFLVRLGIGLSQGLALYFLYRAQDAVRFWPATQGLIFAPLLLCWLFIPLLAHSALGEMPRPRALTWTVLAALIVALLAVGDVWQAWPHDYFFRDGKWFSQAHILPSFHLVAFAAAGLFIAHALVVGGHIDRKFAASYPVHFDVAWKLAVQVGLAALFVGIFWLLLFLGSALFNLIKLDFLQRLIRHQWFSIPVTALAVAGSLHLTDVRPALVRGARTLLLTLLSWLLPLITLIVAGFLASLPLTGVTPLWSVGHASGLLLATSAAIIVLINAAHQDGDLERIPPKFLQIAGSSAAVLPLPLSLIAAYALYLRVAQYGWSADRVIVAACLLVSLAYGVGYLRAIWPRDPWLKRIEAWNFRVALLVLAVIIAVLTPIASPSRIAVADQMARLRSGKIAAFKFDVAYLRREGGRYGRLALEALTKSESAALREKSQTALSQTNPYLGIPETPQSFAARVAVYPRGQRLPDTFVTFSTSERAAWELMCHKDCEALLTDLDGDGKAEILLFGPEPAWIQVFREGKGGWELGGLIDSPAHCTAFLDALRSGKFTVASPQRAWNDVVVAGQRFSVADRLPVPPGACPKS